MARAYSVLIVAALAICATAVPPLSRSEQPHHELRISRNRNPPLRPLGRQAADHDGALNTLQDRNQRDVSHSLDADTDILQVRSSDLAGPLSVVQVLVSFAALFVAAAVVKAVALVPRHVHSRVDRVTFAACISIVLCAIMQRIIISAAVGDLTMTRFMQYFAAGGICAFLTHAACTPIDVVKTRIQTSPSGKYHGLLDGTRKIVSEEGPHALLKGLGATAGGYFLHGAFKYSFYEVFKVILSPNAALAIKPPLSIAALAGFGAECIACLLLCPMEAIRIRSVADPGFPAGVVSGLAVISRLEGFHGLYKGLPAMMLKQVPYTVGQFVSFELAVKVVRACALFLIDTSAGTPSWVAAAISTTAGLSAGVMAAIISHPGDTILSKINQEEGDGDAVTQIQRVVRATGFVGLFAGLTVRIIQVSCMIGGQFLIYDTIKLWCGILPASAVGTAAAHALARSQGAHMKA